jgi:ATP-binding cassette subfamily F protein 3
MRHTLTLALQDYQGALIVVSHDRHLLRTVTDEFLLVANGGAQPFNGDLDDYRDWLNAQQRVANRDATSGNAGAGNSAVERREQKRQDAERRQQLAIKRKPLDQQIRKLEQRMELLHQEQKTLDVALADSASYEETNKNRLKEWLLRKGEVGRELAALETKWLEVQEAIEALVSDD